MIITNCDSTTCTRREPSFTRAKKSSGTWETSIADFNWSLFIPVPKGTQASKLCVCVFPLACLFLRPPSGSRQKWFSANFVPLGSVLPGLFDCTYITTDKPLTLALPITNYKFHFLKCLETSKTTWKYKKRGFIWIVTDTKGQRISSTDSKVIKTWITHSTPSFILRKVKGLRGHLSKSRKYFTLNYWWESQFSFP